MYSVRIIKLVDVCSIRSPATCGYYHLCRETAFQYMASANAGSWVLPSCDCSQAAIVLTLLAPKHTNRHVL